MKSFNFNKTNNVSNDEHLAREILNICSEGVEVTEDFLLFLNKINSRHLLLAKKMLNKDSAVIQDMILFEYLVDNVLSADDFEDEEVFF